MSASAYDEIRAEVEHLPGRHTINALMRTMIAARGGSPAVWNRRTRALIAGGALRHEVNPDAVFRRATKRLYPGDVPVAVAVAADARRRAPLARERAGAPDPAGRRVVGSATPPTDHHVHDDPTTLQGWLDLPDDPADRGRQARFAAWINSDEVWYGQLTMEERSFWNHDRHAKEQRFPKRAKRQPGSQRLLVHDPADPRIGGGQHRDGWGEEFPLHPRV